MKTEKPESLYERRNLKIGNSKTEKRTWLII
jgi:hypothetical protein